MNTDLIEKVAEAIYRAEGGLTDEEYTDALGELRRVWKTDAPFDTNPGELCEWEREGYRAQAKAAILTLNHNLPLFKMNGRGQFEKIIK